jgi:hypothetical protein
MKKDSSDTAAQDKRSIPRRTKLQNYRVEIQLVGQPIYQFRVKDVSTKGAGILIKNDSGFLNLIKVGQIVNVDFISPEGTEPSGFHKSKIEHITEGNRAGIKGHLLVGILILEKIDQPDW